MLKIDKMGAGYGKLQVIWDVSFQVGEGEFVALLGANGVGKTTTLRCISGLLKPCSGDIFYQGNSIKDYSVQEIYSNGISFITDDGYLFDGMTVKENLLMGAYIIRDKLKKEENLEKVLELFPRLKERIRQTAGTLSGGERKMVAIARGLMSSPKLMLIDEPSLGLAPKVIADVFETLKLLTDQGVTILLVEQNARTTLRFAERAYILELSGVTSGNSKDLLANPEFCKNYLSVK